MSNMEIINYCEHNGLECDKKTIEAPVKGTIYYFCCYRGFEQSTKDFIEFIKNNNSICPYTQLYKRFISKIL